MTRVQSMARHAATFRLVCLICGWGIMIGFVGCWGGDGLVLLPVEGQVTLNGKPVDQATVIFSPSNGRPSYGYTDKNGVYRLEYSAQRQGALVGKHVVAILTEIEGLKDEASGATIIAPRKEMLPSRYRDGTALSATVERGQQRHNFELVTK